MYTVYTVESEPPSLVPYHSPASYPLSLNTNPSGPLLPDGSLSTRPASRRALHADQRFHALRHTYASLCQAVGVPVREVAKFMGHANTATTEHIYTHLFDTDDHSGAMAALDALDPATAPENVVPLRRIKRVFLIYPPVRRKQAPAFWQRRVFGDYLDDDLGGLGPAALVPLLDDQVTQFRRPRQRPRPASRTSDREVGAQARWVWEALSRSVHHHAYELQPSVAEVRHLVSQVRGLAG